MDSTLMSGQRFANDFVVEGLLSEGGMGAIYVATQEATRKRCALKVMKSACVRDPAMRSRFAQEAMVSSSIASEHKVDVLAAGVDTLSGMPWIAMELLEGETLTAFLQKRGRLSSDAAHGILEQLLHCLAAAHKVGVVHRDLKPDNVFVAQSHRVGASSTIKVLDFGIAKLVAGAAQSETQPMGSPFWLAPEQASRGAAITPSTDVWSAGLLAFWLLSGKSYWLSAQDRRCGLMEFLRELFQGELPSASRRAADLGVAGALPAGFDAWFARCVARHPAQRFPDANAAWESWLASVAPRTDRPRADAPSAPGEGADRPAVAGIQAGPAPSRPAKRWPYVLAAAGLAGALAIVAVSRKADHIAEGPVTVPAPTETPALKSSAEAAAPSAEVVASVQLTAEAPPVVAPPAATLAAAMTVPTPATLATATQATRPPPATARPEMGHPPPGAPSVQKTSAAPAQVSSSATAAPTTPPIASCSCGAKDRLCLAACKNQR